MSDNTAQAQNQDMIAQEPKNKREIAKKLKADGMKCNCDLDNWEPEQSTGHSWVCRIHKAAIKMPINIGIRK